MSECVPGPAGAGACVRGTVGCTVQHGAPWREYRLPVCPRCGAQTAWGSSVISPHPDCDLTEGHPVWITVAPVPPGLAAPRPLEDADLRPDDAKLAHSDGRYTFLLEGQAFVRANTLDDAQVTLRELCRIVTERGLSPFSVHVQRSSVYDDQGRRVSEMPRAPLGI